MDEIEYIEIYFFVLFLLGMSVCGYAFGMNRFGEKRRKSKILNRLGLAMSLLALAGIVLLKFYM